MADNDVIKLVGGHQEIGPLLSADIIAAAEAADSPSAANPFATVGGSDAAVVRLRRVTLTYAQMAAPDGGLTINTVYTLQPGDWLLLASVIVTEAFNDSAAPLWEVDGWNGISQTQLSDPSGVDGTVVATNQNGLRSADGDVPGDGWKFVPNSQPVTPTTTAIDIQLRGGWAADGNAGSATVLLWVAEF